MPQRPPRACPDPSCGGYVGTCRHSTRQRPHRPSTSDRGYDARWQRLVALAKRVQRAEYGFNFCEDCGITEAQAKAQDNPLSGDHKVWPAVTVDDVDIVCRRDNSRRGALRTGVSG